MSYDLAVWEGERPADDRAAGRAFMDLYDRYVDTEAEHPPTERIAAYVAALLERWCDVTEDVEDTSPWSTGPLIGEARGPLVYFPMRWSMAERRPPPMQRPSQTPWGWSALTLSRIGLGLEAGRRLAGATPPQFPFSLALRISKLLTSTSDSTTPHEGLHQRLCPPVAPVGSSRSGLGSNS
jgi:hypothetical protein